MARKKTKTYTSDQIKTATDAAKASKNRRAISGALSGIKSDTYDANMRYVGGEGGKKAPFVTDELWVSSHPAGMNPNDYHLAAKYAKKHAMDVAGGKAAKVHPWVIEGYKNDALRARDAGDLESAKKLADAVNYFETAKRIDRMDGGGGYRPQRQSRGGQQEKRQEPQTGRAGNSKPTGKSQSGDGWTDPEESNPLKRFGAMVMGNKAVQIGLKGMRMPYSYVASHVSDVAQELEDGDIGGAVGALGRGVGLGVVGETADALKGKGFDIAGVLNSYENEKNRKDFWKQTGVGTYLQRGLDKHTWDDDTILNDKWAKRFIGAAGDFGLDPMTYLTAGTTKLAGTSAQVATRIAEAGVPLAEREVAAAIAKAAASGADEVAQQAAGKLARKEAESYVRRASADVISKGKRVLRKQDIQRLFPEEKVAGGLAWRVPGTGRISRGVVGGLTGGRVVPEEKLIPLLSKNVTNPLQRVLSKPARALGASKFADKVSAKYAGEYGQEIRNMIRSGNPDEVYSGLGVKRSMNMLRSKAAAGVMIDADTIRTLFPEHADKLIKAAGTDAEVGSQLTTLWMKAVAPAIKGREAEILKAVEMGTPDAVEGGREVANFYAAAHRALKKAGLPVGEIPDGQYIPRMFTAEGKEALLAAAEDVPKGTIAHDPKAPFMKHRATLQELGVSNQAEARALLETLYGKGAFETDLYKISSNYMRYADQQLGRKAMLDELVGWGIAHPTDSAESIDDIVKNVMGRKGGRPIPNDQPPFERPIPNEPPPVYEDPTDFVSPPSGVVGPKLMDVSSFGDSFDVGMPPRQMTPNEEMSRRALIAKVNDGTASEGERRALQALEQQRMAAAAASVESGQMSARAAAIRGRGEPWEGFAPDPWTPPEPVDPLLANKSSPKFKGYNGPAEGIPAHNNFDPATDQWIDEALPPNPTDDELDKLAQLASSESGDAAIEALRGNITPRYAQQQYGKAVATRVQHIINEATAKSVSEGTEAPLNTLMKEIDASPHSSEMYRQLEEMGRAERRAIAWDENPMEGIGKYEDLSESGTFDPNQSKTWGNNFDPKQADVEGDIVSKTVKRGRRVYDTSDPTALQKRIDEIDAEVERLNKAFVVSSDKEADAILKKLNQLGNERDHVETALWEEGGAGSILENAEATNREQGLGNALVQAQRGDESLIWKGQPVSKEAFFGKDLLFSHEKTINARTLQHQRNLGDVYLGVQRVMDKQATQNLATGQEAIKQLDTMYDLAGTLQDVRRAEGVAEFSVPSSDTLRGKLHGLGAEAERITDEPLPLSHEIAADLLGPRAKAFYDRTVSQIKETQSLQSIDPSMGTPAEVYLRGEEQLTRLYAAIVSGKDEELTRVMIQQVLEGPAGRRTAISEDALDNIVRAIHNPELDVRSTIDSYMAPSHPMGGPQDAPIGAPDPLQPPPSPYVTETKAQAKWDAKRAGLEQRKRLIIAARDKRGYTTSAEGREFKALKQELKAMGERPKPMAVQVLADSQAAQERLVGQYNILKDRYALMRGEDRIRQLPSGAFAGTDEESQAVVDAMAAMADAQPWLRNQAKPDWQMEGADWADVLGGGGAPAFKDANEAKEFWNGRMTEEFNLAKAAKEAGDTAGFDEHRKAGNLIKKRMTQIEREFRARSSRKVVPADIGSTASDAEAFYEGSKLAEQRIKEGRADETLAHIRNKLQSPNLTPSHRARLEGGLKRLEEHAATMDAVEKVVAPKAAPVGKIRSSANIWDDHAAGHYAVIPTNTVVKSNGEAVMGAGLAKQARDKFKGLSARYGAYLRDAQANGTSTMMVDHENRLILVPTKGDWKLPSSIEQVDAALTELGTLDLPMSVPNLGAGNGQVPLADVEALMAKHGIGVPQPAPVRVTPPPELADISPFGDMYYGESSKPFNPLDEFKTGTPKHSAFGGSNRIGIGPETIDDYINRKIWNKQIDPVANKPFASRERYAEHLLNLDSQRVASGKKPYFLESTPAGARDRARVLGIPEAGAADPEMLADPAPILNGQHDDELVARLDAQAKDPAAAPQARRTARDTRNWVQNKQRRVIAAVDSAGGDSTAEAAIAAQSQAENAGAERFLRYPTSDPTKTFKQLNKLTTVRNLAKLAEDQGSRIVWLQKSQGLVTDSQVAELLNQVATVSTPEGMRNFLGYYDKFMTYVKAWQLTTPGFHVRNLMGGIFNNYLAGVELGATSRFMRKIQLFKAGKLEGEEAEWMKVIYENVGGGQYSHHEIGVAASIKPSKNPFSPRYGPLRASAAFGGDVEFRLRGALMWDRLSKGTGLQEALDDVTRYHFDYSNLSNFETNAVKRIVPFYVWTRYNFPLQMEMMATTPNKYRYYQQFKRAFEDKADSGKPVPSFLTNEMFGIPLPMHSGKNQMFFTPDLPMTRTLGQALPDAENWNPKKLGTYPTLLDPYFSQMAVPLKLPAELAFSRQFFKGIPIKDTQNTEGYIGTKGPMKPVANFIGGKAKTDYLLEQLMPFYGQGRRMIPAESKHKDRRITNWLSYVGLPVRTNTPRDQENELMRRQYMEK
jgi:hypothetical protein